MPAEAVIDDLRLHRRDFKHLHIVGSMAGAGGGVERAGGKIWHKIGLLQRGWLDLVLPRRRQNAKRRLEGLLREDPVHKIGIAGMQVVLLRRQRPVPQGLEGFDGRSVGIGVSASLQPVKNPPEGPHPFMEMGIQVAVEDRVTDHPIEAPRSI